MKCIISILLLFCLPINGQEHPMREMRGVWIATVENIDWPSNPNLTTAQQQHEMVTLLDLIKEYNLNTIVFQIRPAADAFYQSALEPWSHWLTGKQGTAPDPYYDPLEFAIRECRKRGLDVHVWLNPYRAVRDTASKVVSPGHITNTRPELFVIYGTTKYFDPGLPATRDHVARVVSDIVRRYDIDAIHMDDYFYPYRIAGVNFPDDKSFRDYNGGFNENQRDDWRRHNVDLIIRQLHDSIRAIKPGVAFGISPFGVWRNRDRDSSGSATKAGQTNYDDLFADILKWQRLGWIDYVVPQLYWHIGMRVADYAILADWWNRNAYGCPLYIGQAFYRIDRKSAVKAWRKSRQIVDQIHLNRSLDEIDGSMFFSAKYLRTNPQRLKQQLLRKAYVYPALPAHNNRVFPVVPGPPLNALITVHEDSLTWSWEKGEDAKNYILYKYRIGTSADRSAPDAIFCMTADTSVTVKNNRKTTPKKFYYIITSQSIANVESEPVFFRQP